MQGHLYSCGQVITGAAENVVRRYGDVNVKVSVRATGKTDLTLPAEPQSQAIFDARWNG
jgi:hypothetical protein